MLLAEFTWEMLFTPFGIPITALVCIFGWLTIDSIAQAVSKVMRNRNDSELKLELLARGLTAEEIVRIVEVGRDWDPEEVSQQRHTPTHHHTHAVTS